MPYSYSQYTTHKSCGYKYKLAYIDKVPVDRGVSSPAMERGSRMHDSAEAYVLGSDELDPELDGYKQWLFNLRENYDCRPELQWAYLPDWTPTDFKDPDAYVRGIWDLMILPHDEAQSLDVKEYKTGKIYDDHDGQRHLYGLAGMLMFPQFKSVNVETVYFDKKKANSNTWSLSQLDEMKKVWQDRFHIMTLEASYIPNPSWTCRFCDFSKQKGGPCRFG